MSGRALLAWARDVSLRDDRLPGFSAPAAASTLSDSSFSDGLLLAAFAIGLAKANPADLNLCTGAEAGTRDGAITNATAALELLSGAAERADVTAADVVDGDADKIAALLREAFYDNVVGGSRDDVVTWGADLLGDAVGEGWLSDPTALMAVATSANRTISGAPSSESPSSAVEAMAMAAASAGLPAELVPEAVDADDEDAVLVWAGLVRRASLDAIHQGAASASASDATNTPLVRPCPCARMLCACA